MVGILITGHGNFPSGALSAVNLVAGNPGNVSAVDFVEGMSAEELKEKMQEIAISLHGVGEMVDKSQQ